MMEITCSEANFSCKNNDLSGWYQLYISCKNNKRKALNYKTDLSNCYQLYISCKNNIETPITYPTYMEP